jgi:hypothetical protein
VKLTRRACSLTLASMSSVGSSECRATQPVRCNRDREGASDAVQARDRTLRMRTFCVTYATGAKGWGRLVWKLVVLGALSLPGDIAFGQAAGHTTARPREVGMPRRMRCSTRPEFTWSDFK